MYAEDVLLCSRIKSELKMKLYNVPAAKIIHFEGASIGHFSEHKLKTMLEGTYIYYLKQYGENTARNYVKMMLFVSRLKYLLSKTLKQTDKCYYYSKCCKVYADKLEAIA
jgi:GT2 family glycosyltransferase